jgi:hypothetical protein
MSVIATQFMPYVGIASWPRGGNHLVRYLIEKYYGQQTLGEPTGEKNVEEGTLIETALCFKEQFSSSLGHVDTINSTAIGQKIHLILPHIQTEENIFKLTGFTLRPYTHAIYIIRHPLEHLLSSIRALTNVQPGVEATDAVWTQEFLNFLQKKEDPTTEEIHEYFDGQGKIAGYIHHMAENYYQFCYLLQQGIPKLVVFYEDLVGNRKHVTTNQIVDFIGDPHPATYRQEFFANLKETFKESLGGPQRQPRSVDDFEYYRNHYIKNDVKKNLLEELIKLEYKKCSHILERYF